MNRSTAFWSAKYRCKRHQKGIAAVVVTIGMVALLAVTGLALDTGHMLVNKTRIQNAVDAAALAAARTLQTESGNMLQARTDAGTVFNNNLSGELSDENPSITVTFSSSLNPGSFFSSVTSPRYVKVETSTIPLQSFLVRLVGYDNKQVSATAVAGFASGANICSLIPVMVCARDASMGSFNGYEPYVPGADNEIITLKVGSGNGPDPGVGSGNFHLLDLPGLQGANDIRFAFAGNPACSGIGLNEPVDLAPGNKVGPTVEGINTRFGLYSGPMRRYRSTYPGDFANDTVGGCTADCSSPDNYFSYYATTPLDSSSVKYERRIVTVPIADCSIPATGNNTPVTMTTQGFGCFFLTEPASQQGGAQNESGSFKGIFIDECDPPGTGVTSGAGAEIIVLYKNPDGDDT